MPLDDARFAAGLRDCTAALAAIVTADPARPVPTCPGWAFRQLATHVGRGHRWAAEIVTTRAAGFISPADVPDGRLPEGAAEQAAWLNASADMVIGAVTAAGDEKVWTFLGPRPARWWLRRRAHEVAVHLADAQLASGQEPALDAGLAADGIGEWLELVAGSSRAVTDSARARGEALRGDGQSLHFHATDPGIEAGEWLARRTPDGVTAEPGHARADVAVRGPAVALLLMLTRRLPVSARGIEVHGDRALLDHWLASTPF
jgi:uncharacterized protein (TIGR03083 family)